MTTTSSRNADAPGQVGGDEATEQRPHGGGDRGGRAHEGVDPALRRALEVAVDERLHGGQQQRRAQSAENGPEHDDGGDALGERHGQRADGIAEQAQHVGPLAADEIADLAPDEDERGRDQRLQRDGGLHAAGGRVQIVDHRRDRHVHQRGVDHQHEHGHGQEKRESAIGRRRPGRIVRHRFGHRAIITSLAVADPNRPQTGPPWMA